MVTVPGWATTGSNGWVHNTIGKKIGGQAVNIWSNDTSVSRVQPVTAAKNYDFSCYLASFTGQKLTAGQAVVRVQWLDAGSSVTRIGCPYGGEPISRASV